MNPYDCGILVSITSFISSFPPYVIAVLIVLSVITAALSSAIICICIWYILQAICESRRTKDPIELKRYPYSSVIPSKSQYHIQNQSRKDQ